MKSRRLPLCAYCGLPIELPATDYVQREFPRLPRSPRVAWHGGCYGSDLLGLVLNQERAIKRIENRGKGRVLYRRAKRPKKIVAKSEQIF